jgi:hypothetical protein
MADSRLLLTSTIVYRYLPFSTLKTEQNTRDIFVAHFYELSPRPISTA